MVKKSTKKAVKASTPAVPSMKSVLEDHHVAFSHIMYALFLVSTTFAAFYTFNALGSLSNYANTEYFYPIVAIMMLLWSFLFWEFGHRIHTA